MEYWSIISGILAILVIILFIRLNKKQYLDNSEKDSLDREIYQLEKEKLKLSSEINDLNKKSDLAIERYNNSVRDKTEELENYFAAQKQRRQQILEEDMEQRKLQMENQLELTKLSYEEERKQVENSAAIAIKDCLINREIIESETEELKKRYLGLLAPLQQYEKDKQAQLFYTIQVPDEYKEDINFLITTVSQKVQHPDIINKLVWNEYVKPYIEDTFRRVGIEDKPGIYKITNIDNGKAYIGKSTNMKKRLADHFKSSIGIQAIADQAVHHEIWKTGFWNWLIEPIIYCEKEQLNEFEKYYIDFFDTVNKGYNKNKGGGG